MKKKIVIFGSGVHAKVIFHSIINNDRFKFLGFVDHKDKNKTIIKFKGVSYKIIDLLKNLDVIKKFKNLSGIIGVGSNFERSNLYKLVQKKKIKINWETIIFKGTNISNNVNIGEGSVIMANSTLNNNVTIESHVIINTGSIIEHDNFFGKFSSTGPGVTTGGNVEVGDLSHLGIGSTILNGKKIGSNTVIGGGSLINKNCKSYSVYFGVPAKIRGRRKYNKKYL